MTLFQKLGVGLVLACPLLTLRAFVIEVFIVPVPAERLIADAERKLKATPESAEAHYALARCHYIAFSRDFGGVDMSRGEVVERYGEQDLPWRKTKSLDSARVTKAGELAYAETDVPSDRLSRAARGALNQAYERQKAHLDEIDWKPDGDQPLWKSIEHAETAWREFQIACELDPRQPLYRLSEASFIEQFLRWAAVRQPARMPAELSSLKLPMAVDSYLQAFRLAEYDQRSTRGGVWWQLIYEEAASSVLRLAAQQEKPNEQCASPTAEMAEVQAGLARLAEANAAEEKRRRESKEEALTLVTPMVLALKPVQGLSALLPPGRTVEFDLAGYGVTQRWPWLSASAGLLVWDPERRGIVASGRQLFGNFTFQLIWRDGYTALAALDDNGDGELTADELKGIRLWFDINGDGRSSPDEVHDLAEYGIVGLAVRATGQDGFSPTNARGVRFADGRVLPTWDWTTEPAKPSVSGRF